METAETAPVVAPPTALSSPRPLTPGIEDLASQGELDVKHLGTNSSIQSPLRRSHSRPPTLTLNLEESVPRAEPELRRSGTNSSILSPRGSQSPRRHHKVSWELKTGTPAELDVKHVGTSSSVQSPTGSQSPRRRHKISWDMKQICSRESDGTPLSPPVPSAKNEVRRRSTCDSGGSVGAGSAMACTKTSGSMVAPTRVEASLLRAVTTSTLLQRCAASFRSQEFVEQNYQKSFETKHINDFVSHDWASSRFGKLLALCLVYNSKAALIASTLTGLLLAGLQYGPNPILPSPLPAVPEAAQNFTGSSDRGERASKYGYWSMVLAPLVFAIFFLFWQDMRFVGKLGTRTCFLDKYCIDQANPERKAAGILGLAGFLRCSDRIIILWTPRYFTRLWCTYEVASWLHLQKPLTSVLFMPLAHANIVMTLMAAGWFSFLLLVATAPYFPQFYLQLVGTGLLFGLSAGAHQARHSAAHLRAIKDQLSDFSVTSSDCFCCSVGHVQNGEDIPCDREVVYSTIAEWFNDARDSPYISEDAALDRFDRAVRVHFAAQVLQKAGPTQLSYRYAVMAGWPYLYRVCDVLAGGYQLERSFVLNALIMYCTITLAATPVWYKFAMHLACRVDVLVGVPRRRLLDYCLSVVLGFGYVVAALLIWFPLEVLASGSPTPFPMIAVALFFFALNVQVYFWNLREYFCGMLVRRLSRRASADAAPPMPLDTTIFDVNDDALVMDEGIPAMPPVELRQVQVVRICPDEETVEEKNEGRDDDCWSTRTLSI